MTSNLKTMKLLIITAIAAFDKTSKNVETSRRKTFSYKEVTGFKDISENQWRIGLEAK
jgi:hypothetical protein